MTLPPDSVSDMRGHNVSLTLLEIVLLLGAIRIAREDGSIYGDDSDKTMDEQLNRIVTKLNEARG
jgi:hypothetical protein